MRKISLLLLVVLLAATLLLSGCLNYKAYDVPEEETTEEDQDLLAEIAEIERQLEENDLVSDTEELTVVEEEVALPDFGEESAETIIIEVDESDLVKLNHVIIDPDNDHIEYAFLPPLSSLGVWQTNYGDAGEYYSTLTASDGVHTTEQELLLVVNRVNVAPELDGVRDMTYREGDQITFDPIVSDPNKDAVSITVSEPLSEGVWLTDHTSAGEYEIIVTASDGELSTEETFFLTIQDVNVLPTVEGLDREVRIMEGETVELSPSIEDLDGDYLSVRISEPVGDDGIWETGFTDHGTYDVTITVDDGKDVVREVVTVIVEDINMPPQIIDVSLALE